MNEAYNPRADSLDEGLRDSGRALSAPRYPTLLLGAIILVLALAQLLAMGVHGAQMFIYLGYFLPIAISAFHFSRRRAIAIAAVCAAVYAAAFIPSLFVMGGMARELFVEIVGHDFYE